MAHYDINPDDETLYQSRETLKTYIKRMDDKKLIRKKKMAARNVKVSVDGGGCGCGTIGVVIAVILSWQTWHSILWAAVHGLFNWFYVIYWWLYYSGR